MFSSLTERLQQEGPDVPRDVERNIGSGARPHPGEVVLPDEGLRDIPFLVGPFIPQAHYAKFNVGLGDLEDVRDGISFHWVSPRSRVASNPIAGALRG